MHTVALAAQHGWSLAAFSDSKILGGQLSDIAFAPFTVSVHRFGPPIVICGVVYKFEPNIFDLNKPIGLNGH